MIPQTGLSGKALLLFCCLAAGSPGISQPRPEHGLLFDSLARRWDEAIPIGNGWLGALIWQKQDQLRISLDRVDLWDDRPMPEIDRLKFRWVVEQVFKGQYDTVQRLGDEPYEKYAAPTKIPGAALEFNLNRMGKVVRNRLDIQTGKSMLQFENGLTMYNYVHARQPIGYFGFEKIPAALWAQGWDALIPALVAPTYNSGKSGTLGNSVEGQGLERLGYARGTIVRSANSIRYHQPTWNGGYYEVLVQWKALARDHIIGQWTISNGQKAALPVQEAAEQYWAGHQSWWSDYWSRSSVSLPDSLLERQYYLELYKWGSVARGNTPPVSLQAIWTADNGLLPPWKGDFHHDLNTQLSYWPGYMSNHLDLTEGYTRWLWKVREQNRRWTRQYYELEGLNVPGVTTLSGKEMGGWIQYSTSPTTAAWLAQHFYWQWKYSGDRQFLRDRAIPYFNEVHVFLSGIMKKDTLGHWRLPLSSSPEYHNNSLRAWFREFTNYDLSLVRAFYQMGLELSLSASGIDRTAWLNMLNHLPDDATNATGLQIAPGQNLDESHRHHAHLMAIYPLGLMPRDEIDQEILLRQSLRHLEKMGTREWCGYSFSWAACIYARVGEADNAVMQLQRFANNFCSSNSFHLNGDQRGGQYSNFTYRPFTLEGNFAFAQGVHELLLQSYKGYIEIFPAVPASWKDVAFQNLRTEGGFLVTALRRNGITRQVSIQATTDGVARLQLPFQNWRLSGGERNAVEREPSGRIAITLSKGQAVVIEYAD